MPLEKSLEEAIRIATAAHAGQVDKAGQDYINHLEAVASKCETTPQKIVAWLHDTLEDTSVTAADLAQMFPAHIVDAVQAVTRQPNEDYFAFVRRAGSNPIARAVKIADLTHNMDLSRLAAVTENDWERHKKYEQALLILNA